MGAVERSKAAIARITRAGRILVAELGRTVTR